jgi:hypothetical protein
MKQRLYIYIYISCLWDWNDHSLFALYYAYPQLSALRSTPEYAPALRVRLLLRMHGGESWDEGLDPEEKRWLSVLSGGVDRQLDVRASELVPNRDVLLGFSVMVVAVTVCR